MIVSNQLLYGWVERWLQTIYIVNAGYIISLALKLIYRTVAFSPVMPVNR